ncbi:MAG: molybdopterin oxidoreductase, partial [Dehalococcoidia bacterium]|nr:molybdopterin oxidoreductase [Dehalococcoidia bacterium]
IRRLLNQTGGCSVTWAMISGEACTYAVRAFYGTGTNGNTRDDLFNSHYVILWGWNPSVTIWDSNTSYILAQVRERGIPIVAVDPRYTDSVATFANQWIPIRPGADTAMMVAMAHVIISKNLHDQPFIDKYSIGFDQFKDYVLGKEDGIPKTPAWAEPITGVPADTIEKLAIAYATNRPSALIAGFGPGRSARGEQYHRAAMTLATITGNVGVHGGNAAGAEINPVVSSFGVKLPVEDNPVDKEFPFPNSSMDTAIRVKARPHISLVWDAVLKGKAGGYPADYKMLYLNCVNQINQFPNANKGVQALKKLEFVVVHDTFITSTARYADIVLPITTILERNDFCRPWLSGTHYLFNNQAINPIGESKSDWQIACDLAPRLGITNFGDKSEDEWLREIYKASPDMCKQVPDYDTFKKDGVHKVKLSGPQVAFEQQIKDPANNPFPTRSGKIEIYAKRLADLNNPLVPPVPKYVEPWESPNDPLAKKYPLQLITTHFKRRIHSMMDNNSWLKELIPQAVQINARDAAGRGIADGDMVRVFNDRGQVAILARVTERIMPGVVDIPEGAWFNPDSQGVDRGGCGNTLTKDEVSPGGALCSNTCLVQVEKFGRRG